MNQENNNLNNQQLTNQHPIMNNQFYNQPSKKKNTTLIVGLSIVGIFILGIVLLFITFFIEEKQDRPWKSGQVQILGKNIQLPCDVDTFESTLNTKITVGKYVEEIQDVKIKVGYNSVLIFSVYVDDDMVTGIMLNAYESDEEYKPDPYDSYAFETERDTALNVVFPGDVNIETPVNEIKKLYSTRPFNVNYTYSDEKIGSEQSYKLSAYHKFQNNEWEINIKSIDGEITEISYFYLNY